MEQAAGIQTLQCGVPDDPGTGERVVRFTDSPTRHWELGSSARDDEDPIRLTRRDVLPESSSGWMTFQSASSQPMSTPLRGAVRSEMEASLVDSVGQLQG